MSPMNHISTSTFLPLFFLIQIIYQISAYTITNGFRGNFTNNFYTPNYFNNEVYCNYNGTMQYWTVTKKSKDLLYYQYKIRCYSHKDNSFIPSFVLRHTLNSSFTSEKKVSNCKVSTLDSLTDLKIKCPDYNALNGFTLVYETNTKTCYAKYSCVGVKANANRQKTMTVKLNDITTSLDGKSLIDKTFGVNNNYILEMLNGFQIKKSSDGFYMEYYTVPVFDTEYYANVMKKIHLNTTYFDTEKN